MLDTDACWHDTADIVAVGYGGAGAVAAIAAHDLGAEVLVLEKQPREGHCTNTSMSAGAFLCPTGVEAVSRHLDELYNTRLWRHNNNLLVRGGAVLYHFTISLESALGVLLLWLGRMANKGASAFS